ncbi:MAG: DUF1349 domain-containing protein [Clostridiales bacterium]|uniref:DUF1349 domain-containing protein n=1 Tax=Candidatus Pullilachnospira stercoravium TaxID=2840913 RepID=A0A9D1T7B5_9FIRM|nr:DUF1349 domain-containing protein [Clostridiales bacterium]HIV14247.1 DUF1349 domain-containing protein [Candidatus Pullilachnospira stercoravium]
MKFQWLNESEITEKDNRIEITAPAKSDFFRGSADERNGAAPMIAENAPFYYTEIDGDFVLKVRVSLEFKDTYDSACVMVMKDMGCWAKVCYELTDFGTRAAVSVVTKGDSDDANGCNLEGDAAWLKVCRVGNHFTFHYSTDGERFYMMRYFHLPADPVMKVGLLAQAPTGDGGVRIFENLTIEKRTVENIRAGE